MQTEDLIAAEAFCAGHQIELSFIRTLHASGLIDMTIQEGTVYVPADELSALERFVRWHYDLAINPEGIEALVDRNEDEEPPEAPRRGSEADPPDGEGEDLEGRGPGEDAGCQGDHPQPPGGNGPGVAPPRGRRHVEFGLLQIASHSACVDLTA